MLGYGAVPHSQEEREEEGEDPRQMRQVANPTPGLVTGSKYVVYILYFAGGHTHQRVMQHSLPRYIDI